jgi:hypothetical protein
VDDQGQSGFLPPEPAGPAPELGGRPAQPPPAAAPPPVYGQGQQQEQQAYPPPAYGQAPPAGAWYPPPQPWAYPQQAVPDNSQAVAGFILSLVAGGLLLISAGLSSIISVGCAIAGLVLSRRGVKRVDAGETPKNRSLGQAGFWIGLVSLILSAIATAAWVAVFIAALSDEDFRDDLEREFDESESLSVVGALAVRAALQLLT